MLTSPRSFKSFNSSKRDLVIKISSRDDKNSRKMRMRLKMTKKEKRTKK